MQRRMISGTDCLEGVEGFVAGFKPEALLNLLFHKLHVLEQVVVGLYAIPACHLDDLDTIVAPVYAGSDAESAGEQAVL